MIRRWLHRLEAARVERANSGATLTYADTLRRWNAEGES